MVKWVEEIHLLLLQTFENSQALHSDTSCIVPTEPRPHYLDVSTVDGQKLAVVSSAMATFIREVGD